MTRQSVRVALIYALFGVIWIFGSDRLAHVLLPQYEEHVLAQTTKGIFFVLSSAILIYFLLCRELASQQRLHLRANTAESRLRQVTEQASDLFYVYDMLPQPHFTYVSPSCLKITGYSVEEHYADAQLGFKLVHPDDRHLLENLGDSAKGPVTLRFIRKDGKTIYIEQNNVAEYGADGKMVSISGIGRDVTTAELARQNLELLNQAHTVLWQINRLIVRGHDEKGIYAEACRIPFSSQDFSLVWIGLVDRQNNRVTLHCSEGSKDNYLEGLNITLDDTPTGRGPSGRAARFGEACCSTDIATDPIMLPWRDKALANGFRSSGAFPIKVDGEVVAVWTLYSPIANYFSWQIQSLYQQLAGDISFALQSRKVENERSRLQFEIKESKDRYARLVDQLPVIVYQITRAANGKYALDFLSNNALNLFAIRPEDLLPEIIGQFNFIHPGDREIFHEAQRKTIENLSRFDWRGRITTETGVKYVRMHSMPESLPDGSIRWNGIIEDETALVDAKAESQIAQERWKFALKATGDGLWDWNTVTDEVYFSPTLPGMLGYTPDEWGTTLSAWESRVHPDDRENARRAIQDHFDGKSETYRCEMRMRCRDGSYIWILDRGQVIDRDTDGKPLRMIGLHKDLTREIVIRDEIAAREDYLNTIIAQAPVGIAITATETAAMISANPRFCAILGRNEQELLKLNWKDLTHPDDIEANEVYLAEMIAGRSKGFVMQKRFLRPDGAVVWAKLTVAELSRQPDQSAAHIAIIEDLTESIEREERLRKVFDESPIGIAIIDSDTAAIVSANPTYAKITGRTIAELQHLTWKDFTYADDITADQAMMDELNAGKRHSFQMKKRLLKPDGTLFWIRMSVAKLSQYHGARRIHVCMVEDIDSLVAGEQALNASLSMLKMAQEVAHLGSWELDYQTGKMHWSDEMYRIFEVDRSTPEDALADLIISRCHPDDRERLVLARRTPPTADRPREREYRILSPRGDMRHIFVHDAETTKDDHGNVVSLSGIAQDITERREAERLMRLHAAVIEHTRDGVVITDPTPRIVSVNAAYTAITGYSAEEAIGKNPNIVASGRQHKLFYADLWAELKLTGKWQGELYNRRKNGEVYPQISTIDTIYDANGKVQYYVGVFSDISRLKKSQQSFEKLAHYDILTGLPNRLLVTNRLSHAIETAKRADQMLAVIFLDLDHFKNVNDSLGHEVGDELLISVAGRLRKRLRAEDTVGRLGGDEFLIIAENVQSPTGAAIIARDLLAALAEPFALSTGHSIYTAGSLGICMYPTDGSTTAELVRNADAALYRAKSEGRNAFRFYTNDLTALAKRRLELEAELRRAINNREMTVVYQPVVDIETGEVVGAEALCRWLNKDGQQVSPAEFIPIAEDTGLIVPLGMFVLESACRQAALWARQNRRFRKMAVNVSVRQFQESDWQRQFSENLAETRLPKGLLEIEITESALMQKGNEALAVLQYFKEAGIRVAIDDFGTGYSSLSYLQRFSVDTLKIDQSFVRELAHDPATMQLVRTIIAMARNLNLTILAEGVETEEQLLFLRAEGAGQYQGFLKSPGVPASDFEKRFL